MKTIVTCIDGSLYTRSVCDHAVWAAKALDAPVELFYVLGRRDTASAPLDLSGNLDLGEREALLGELAELDERKARLSNTRARHILDDWTGHLKHRGVAEIRQRLRQGELSETLRESDEDTRLVVIGKRGEAADFAKGHLGSNLERVLRSSRRPVLVASRAFTHPERFLIAFDGGRSSGQIVDKLVESPLVKGLSCHLAMVGDGSGEAGSRFREAEARLRSAGYQVEVHLEKGEPEDAISALVERHSIHLLVMGAYGHSRLRNLFVGSTTAALIQRCPVPVLVIR